MAYAQTRPRLQLDSLLASLRGPRVGPDIEPQAPPPLVDPSEVDPSERTEGVGQQLLRVASGVAAKKIAQQSDSGGQTDGGWDERLPDGTPAMQVGIPPAERPRPTMEYRTGEDPAPALRPRVVAQNVAPPPPPADLPPEQPTPDAPQTRPRIVDPVRRLEDQIEYEHANPAGKSEHRVRDTILAAIVGGMQGAGSQPENPLGGFIGGAGAGAAVQGFRPETVPEFRQQQRVSNYQGQLDTAVKRRKSEADAQLTSARTTRELAQADATLNKPAQDAQKADADRLVRLFNGLPEFDPAAEDTETKEIVEQARKLGVTLPKKTKQNRVTMQISPKGRVLLTDGQGKVWTAKDETGVALDDESKPVPIKPEDLPDSLFGLPDEKTIADEARAAVAPDLKSRRLTDYAAKHYQTADGQFDEARVWQDIEDGVVRPSEVWENTTQQDDQRLAAARNKVRDQYKAPRAEVEKFRLRVSRAKQKDGNPTKKLSDIVDVFNEYSQIKDAKKRREMLDALYQSFDYYNVQ
jgi:hypothetical protein